MRQLVMLALAGVAAAAPPKAPEPPKWQGPTVLTVAGVKPEDAFIRARLDSGGLDLQVRVRALDAEQPLGTLALRAHQPLRLRGLPAGTWAIEAASVKAGTPSRWSDPLVVEVGALGDGVLTVLQGSRVGLPAGCTRADGQPLLDPPAGDHTLRCGEASVKLQVVAGQATWKSPAVLPRGPSVPVVLALVGPVPPLVELVVGGRAWPLRVTPAGLEGTVVVPPGITVAQLRDPDGPGVLAEVVLPGGGK